MLESGNNYFLTLLATNAKVPCATQQLMNRERSKPPQFSVRISQEIRRDIIRLRVLAHRTNDWCRESQPEFLGWLVLCLFVGMRPESEADNIGWSNINLSKGRIIADRTKTRTPRIIDLAFCPPALPWLKEAKRLQARLPIPNMTRRTWQRQMRDAMGLSRIHQDVMRHTAASNLLAYHQDAGKVARFLGNSAGILLRNYVNLTFREDAEKWMALRP